MNARQRRHLKRRLGTALSTHDPVCLAMPFLEVGKSYNVRFALHPLSDGSIEYDDITVVETDPAYARAQDER